MYVDGLHLNWLICLNTPTENFKVVQFDLATIHCAGVRGHGRQKDSNMIGAEQINRQYSSVLVASLKQITPDNSW
jgi:hypothetical protein